MRLSVICITPLAKPLRMIMTGQSQFLTSPVPAQPLAFNLSLDDHGFDDESATQRLEDNDSRLIEMLASQAAHREDDSAGGDEDSVLNNESLPEIKKRTILQRFLHMAASNGDMERVGKLLHGAAKIYIDVNGPDEEGTAPIIYASCFVSFERDKNLGNLSHHCF